MQKRKNGNGIAEKRVKGRKAEKRVKGGKAEKAEKRVKGGKKGKRQKKRVKLGWSSFISPSKASFVPMQITYWKGIMTKFRTNLFVKRLLNKQLPCFEQHQCVGQTLKKELYSDEKQEKYLAV